MNCIRAGLFAALCAIMAACSSAPPPPAPPPAPREPVDGLYRGTSTRFVAESRACPHPGLVTIEVQDHRFQYRWDASTYVSASIGPDGTIEGGAERITLAGHRTGKKLEADVTNGICSLHLTVTRQ